MTSQKICTTAEGFGPVGTKTKLHHRLGVKHLMLLFGFDQFLTSHFFTPIMVIPGHVQIIAGESQVEKENQPLPARYGLIRITVNIIPI